jgi:chromate reductase
MKEMRIAAFAGSLRRHSFNKGLLRASQELCPKGMAIVILELQNIPVYNMDLESDLPSAVRHFKDEISSADGILIATPEHNHSFPGVLKNAIDWASRPYSDRTLTHKPVILQSASTGYMGGIRAQIQLRPVLAYFEMHQMQFPEVIVAFAKEKFDESGNLVDPESRERITKQLEKFKLFIESLSQ